MDTSTSVLDAPLTIRELVSRPPVGLRINQQMFAMIREKQPAAATDEDVHLLIELGATYNLNPLNGEIKLIAIPGVDGEAPHVFVMIVRDGVRAVVERRGLAMLSDVVRENDVFEVRWESGVLQFTHLYGDGDRGKVISAWAQVKNQASDVKGWFLATMKEFEPQLIPEDHVWARNPTVCILAAAERHAGRQAAPLAGLLAYGEAESAAQFREADGKAPISTPGHVSTYDFSALPQPLGQQLADAISGMNELVPNEWSLARCEMTLNGRSESQLEEILLDVREGITKHRDKTDRQREIDELRLEMETPGEISAGRFQKIKKRLAELESAQAA